jgi:predicted membrane protein
MQKAKMEGLVIPILALLSLIFLLSFELCESAFLTPLGFVICHWHSANEEGEPQVLNLEGSP